jgi:hypothetical protein
MTNTETTIQLSRATCRALLEALQPIVSGEQSCAQLTLTDDSNGNPLTFILLGENHNE